MPVNQMYFCVLMCMALSGTDALRDALEFAVRWAVSLNIDLDSEAVLNQKRFLIKCHVSGIQIWAGNPGPGPPTPPHPNPPPPSQPKLTHWPGVWEAPRTLLDLPGWILGHPKQNQKIVKICSYDPPGPSWVDPGPSKQNVECLSNFKCHVRVSAH